ncbi:MAG: hypothetical protein RL518_1287 [Pseudomonadota bacterium]
MNHFVKPDEMAKLSRHPDAKLVQGESGLSYLTVPENVINPQAEKHHCPINGRLEFRSVLVAPVSENGIPFKAPYEE